MALLVFCMMERGTAQKTKHSVGHCAFKTFNLANNALKGRKNNHIE